MRIANSQAGEPLAAAVQVVSGQQEALLSSVTHEMGQNLACLCNAAQAAQEYGPVPSTSPASTSPACNGPTDCHRRK